MFFVLQRFLKCPDGLSRVDLNVKIIKLIKSHFNFQQQTFPQTFAIMFATKSFIQLAE